MRLGRWQGRVESLVVDCNPRLPAAQSLPRKAGSRCRYGRFARRIGAGVRCTLLGGAQALHGRQSLALGRTFCARGAKVQPAHATAGFAPRCARSMRPGPHAARRSPAFSSAPGCSCGQYVQLFPPVRHGPKALMIRACGCVGRRDCQDQHRSLRLRGHAGWPGAQQRLRLRGPAGWSGSAPEPAVAWAGGIVRIRTPASRTPTAG